MCMAEKCYISDFLYNSAPGPPYFTIYFEHTVSCITSLMQFFLTESCERILKR